MSGWTTKKLGEVCEDSIRRLKDIADTKFLYIDIAAIDRERKIIVGATEHDRQTAPGRAQQVVEVGDVLVSTVRPNLNAVAIVEQQPCVRRIASTGFCVLRARECVLPRYIYYFTQVDKFIAKLVAVSEKAAYPSVTDKIVKDVSIPIPPLAEQKRIVAKIDAAFGKIDKLKANAEKNLANAKELFQSALDEAMCPKKGWAEKRLGEVCETITDGDHQPPPKVASGVPFLVISDVSKGRLSFENTRFVPEEYYAKIPEAKKPKIGDVLLTVTGSFGIPVLVDTEKSFCFQRHIALLRSKQVIPRFLVYLLSSHESFKYFDKVATGTAQRTVSLSSLRNMEIVMPPFAEQERIVERIGGLKLKLDALQQNYARQIADCAEMRQAILREAFEGRLCTREKGKWHLPEDWEAQDKALDAEIAEDFYAD